MNGGTIEEQLAFILDFNTGKNPHQRGLSSAVLADEHIDLVSINAVGNPFEGHSAGISPDDTARLEDDFFVGVSHARTPWLERTLLTASFQPS